MERLLESVDSLDSRRFEIAIKRLADSLSYGTDSSPFNGSGLEYAHSRRYVDGDPVKSIDWRVTARTGKYHVKEYESPKRMPVFLMIDTSASMTISSQRRSKYAVAIHIGGGIALAALDRVSPVGVIGVGDRAFRVQPSLSRKQIHQWLYRLRRYRMDESTQLGRRVTELGPSLVTRSLVIVLSDMHDPGGVAALKRLSQEHECVVLHLEDPAERGVPGVGFFRGREAETGRSFVTRGSKPWTDRAAIQHELRRGGIDTLHVPIDQPFTHTLRHFFRSRRLLGRGAR
jgi:uncharacterized protein (DUF58 family)